MVKDFWRDRYKQHNESLPTFSEDIDRLQDNQTPDKILSEIEQRNILYESIATLPEHKQEVVRMFYLEEIGTPDIAEKLGINVATLRRWLMESRDELRRLLGK